MASNSAGKFTKYIKKHSAKFDYTDGIFMSRLPFFLTAIGAYFGLAMASRNETELKDNLIRSAVRQFAFFGGDILIGSILARLSDKLLKTELCKTDCAKNLFNKIIPPTRPLKELNGRSKNIGVALFWVNIASLSALIGFGTPHLINKMIKKDVKKDIAPKMPTVNPMQEFIETKLRLK